MSLGTQRRDFAEFYRRSEDDCLRAVLISVGDQDLAQELVAEASRGLVHHGEL
jgi:RNA polymerase sigma-70 factor (ECF subfamily)